MGPHSVLSSSAASRGICGVQEPKNPPSLWTSEPALLWHPVASVVPESPNQLWHSAGTSDWDSRPPKWGPVASHSLTPALRLCGVSSQTSLPVSASMSGPSLVEGQMQDPILTHNLVGQEAPRIHLCTSPTPPSSGVSEAHCCASFYVDAGDLNLAPPAWHSLLFTL